MIRRGFMLFEVLLATIIAGIVLVAMLELMSGGTRSVHATTELSTAIHLANNVHEFALSRQIIKGNNFSYTRKLSTDPEPTEPLNFVNVCNLNGWNSGNAGPINSNGARLSGYPDWTQSCTARAFDFAAPSTLFDPVSSDLKNEANGRKLTVTIQNRGGTVYTCSWILAPTWQKPGVP